MKYAKVQCHIWDDEKFSPLSPMAKYLFMYLLTNKNANSIGFFVIRPGYAVSDTGITRAQFEDALQELISKGFASWDPECSLILLRNYLKHNAIYTDKQASGAAGLIGSLPKSKLLNDFLRIIEEPSILGCGNNPILAHTIKSNFGKQDSESQAPATAPPDKTNNDTGEIPHKIEPEKTGPTKEEIETLVTHWNEICGEKLPKVQTTTDRRKMFIRARLTEHPLSEWPGIFLRVAKSGFLTGQNDKNWRADFDWVMNQNNLVKILEGKYDDRININRPKVGMEAIKESMERSLAREQERVPNDGQGFLPGNHPDPEDV